MKASRRFDVIRVSMLLVAIVLSFTARSSAQIYPFRNYSIQDGLSESVVNAILQDSEGYIWLGTGYGLNKFDGIEFKAYFEESGLNHPRINSLFESANGWLWIGSMQGVNVLKSDSVWSVNELSLLKDVPVLSIYESRDGVMWFGTEGKGLWKLNKDKSVESFSRSTGLADDEVRDILQTEDGSIWVATRNGITVIKDGVLQNYGTEDGLPTNLIRDLHLSSSGELWVGTRSGLCLLTGNGFTVFSTTNGLVDERIQTISEGKDGTLWIGTEAGVSSFSKGGFVNYTTSEGLANNIVYSSIRDREDNILFGTFGGGFSLFLGAFLENYSTEEGLANDLITSVTEDDEGNLWIASYGGGLMKRTESGFDYLGLNEGLPDDRVYHVSNDRNGTMWIGMRDGLSYMEDGRLINIPDEVFPFRKVRHVLHAANGDHWISTYENGIIQSNGETYTRYGIEQGLPSNTILGSVEGEDGSLWIATYSGVVQLKADSIFTYSIQDGVPNNGVMTITKDREGTIWISTFGGIAWYDGVQFVDITEEDGLPGRVCYFLIQDRQGIFWIGTNNGVARLDLDKFYSPDERLREEAIQLLTREQGLISEEMNLGAAYLDNAGHIWMGSVQGVTHLNTANYSGNQVAPVIHINNFTASGARIGSGDVKLPHTNNFVEFEFVGLNYTAPGQVVYEYRIADIDPDWQRTDSRTVRYPSLPPGTHTFEVHARNSNGVWSEDTASVQFEILPPFWLTWWFITIISLIIIGIIYLFYRNYKIMKMVDIERMRVRIASDLHDDVGGSLTEIALQSDFLQAVDMKPEIRQSLSQIGKQCRHVVTSLDDIVWSIDARNDTLGDLTDRMQDYVINVLGSQNFEINYEFENLKMDYKLPVSVKENLYLIFKEAINNVAKYSNGDRVDIHMTNRGGSFTLVIHDNGNKGRGTKKTGQGLRNMEMRAKRIGGNLDVEDQDGFTVRLQGNLN